MRRQLQGRLRSPCGTAAPQSRPAEQEPRDQSVFTGIKWSDSIQHNLVTFFPAESWSGSCPIPEKNREKTQTPRSQRMRPWKESQKLDALYLEHVAVLLAGTTEAHQGAARSLHAQVQLTAEIWKRSL